MPKLELPTKRIAVAQRADDGRWFAGNVEITVEQPRRRGPWRLSLEAALRLGLVEQSEMSRRDSAVRLHRCRVCRGLFIGYYSARLCSDACVDANNHAWVEARRHPPQLTNALRSRAVRVANCHVCGRLFPAQRCSARFCSNRCRQKRYREARTKAPVGTGEQRQSQVSRSR